MHLADGPLVLMLVALTAYTVLGGADFGAGFWSLPWIGGRGRTLRDHAHDSMGPVWETNHVWLVFVLVVCWTCYPRAFGSITSTLAIPLFLAALGIVVRGTAYALRSGAVGSRELRAVDTLFGVASVVTPFALGAAIGGIASGRVPVGNARGDAYSSWLNATSLATGTLAVAVAAYLAAVYLAADASRMRLDALAEAFRRRALIAAGTAGIAAAGGLAALKWDVPSLWDGITSGWALAAAVVSTLAAAATLLCVLQRRHAAARLTAPVAVAGIVAAWALAQSPTLLPGLTVDEAAAGRSTLIAVLAASAIGAAVLVPSLALLYGLVLRGRFDGVAPSREPSPGREPKASSRLLAAAGAALGLGTLLTVLFEGAVLAVGVALLFAFLVSGFLALSDPGPDNPQPRKRGLT